MHPTEAFGEYAAGFSRQVLHADVVHHAKRAVIDWVAAVFAGSTTQPVRLLERTLASDLDRGAASLASGRMAPGRTAALLNGTAAHAAEVDDSYREAMYHPGAATIAAALAAAQEAGADGMQFLRAVVLGYEVSTRIGVAMGRAHYKYWHNTGTVGSFGAAAAAAAIGGLDARRFAHALAIAATFSAGLQQAFRMDSMSKPLHAGRAAEAGVLAAQLAGNGLAGSLDVLDGEVGFGRAMGEDPDWSDVGRSLGHDFHVGRLTFKNHVGCGHTFAAIDAALALRAEHQPRPEDIASVLVATYGPALEIACHDEPADADEARFSMPFVVATALVHGSVRFAAYSPERLRDPSIRALMARTSVTVDPALDRAFPARRAARLVIETRDGRRLEHLQPDRIGDPELPLSDLALEGKLIEFAAPVIGDEQARQLLWRLWGLEELARPHLF